MIAKEGLNKIIHGDCLEILKYFPDNYFDLIFADPPYNLQLPSNRKLFRADGSEVIPVNDAWDKFESYEDYDDFTASWLKECQRVLKMTGTIWVMGMYHNIFRVGKIMQDLGLWFLNDVIWVKIDAMPNFNERRFTNNHETLLWAVKNKYCKNYTFNFNFLKQMNDGEQMKDTDWIFPICRSPERLRDEAGIKLHPTQKPLKLIQQVLLTASKKGDLVLDPFMGSGTTAVVAKALGRNWIGIEKEKRYVDLATNRIFNYN
ncbi:MAG TPA: DNA methyltransferase [bacterium]|nr:DNA methyltransferase [bacterium]HNS34202.1 DNA methyltransferase [bacterium]HNZ73453.1 DNA methyltransferase [bacterium]HOH67616.1 DNA methyltransferase [bacterium]